jgi:hypothetical protein
LVIIVLEAVPVQSVDTQARTEHAAQSLHVISPTVHLAVVVTPVLTFEQAVAYFEPAGDFCPVGHGNGQVFPVAVGQYVFAGQAVHDVAPVGMY